MCLPDTYGVVFVNAPALLLVPVVFHCQVGAWVRPPGSAPAVFATPWGLYVKEPTWVLSEYGVNWGSSFLQFGLAVICCVLDKQTFNDDDWAKRLLTLTTNTITDKSFFMSKSLPRLWKECSIRICVGNIDKSILPQINLLSTILIKSRTTCQGISYALTRHTGGGRYPLPYKGAPEWARQN